jgi:hypothetical protein
MITTMRLFSTVSARRRAAATLPPLEIPDEEALLLGQPSGHFLGFLLG